MNNLKYQLKLDPNYLPAILFVKDYLKRVKQSENYEELIIVVEREEGLSEAYKTVVFGDEIHFQENVFYVERLVKTLLWLYGGFKVVIVGPVKIYEEVKRIYQNERKFDSDFMSRVYEQPFVVEHSDTIPNIISKDKPIGKNLEGYRIGFDAGGSDMKVSAVVNGKPIFSTEIVWLPKLNKNPEYHQKNIRKAIYLAASKMPRVDALGVSSAGIYINNKAKVASLFILVEDEAFEKHVKNIYIDIARELNVPLEVANDGDVTALAGAMSLKTNNLLGIAMGTSEAVGYINENGNITGWLNELAFVPVDFQNNGPIDEWSGDVGVGCKYFSQDAVIRLAESSGFKFLESLSLAEKLKVIQSLEPTEKLYQDIYQTIGAYLGFTLAYYSLFYKIEVVLLLGRVMSGVGGEIIVSVAQEILNKEFPELGKHIKITMPDEYTRRVGQSIAAASLAKI